MGIPFAILIHDAEPDSITKTAELLPVADDVAASVRVNVVTYLSSVHNCTQLARVCLLTI